MKILPISRPCALLFDLDGTLADSLWVMRAAYTDFLKSFEISATDAEFEALNGPPLKEVVHRLKLIHQLKANENLLLKNYNQFIDKIYREVKPSQGAQALLQKAKDNHCSIGIVTSNSAKRTQLWLEMVNLSHFIDFIVSGDELLYGKPHPEPYLSAIQKTGCNAQDIIAIEDSPQGAQSAIAAGLHTVGLTQQNNQHHVHLLKETHPFSTLEQLSYYLWP